VRNERESPDREPRAVPDGPLLAPLARTSPTRSWLWPAVALTVVLGVVIGVGRLGMAQDAAPSSAPAPTLAAAVNLPNASLVTVPRESPAQVATPAPAAEPAMPRIGPPIAERRNGQRFVDGIPTSIAQTPVLRVRDVAALPLGTIALVGGWYYGPDCHTVFRPGPCPASTISDVPSGSPRIASLALDSHATGSGARVFRAQTEIDPGCLFSSHGCLPRLHVIDNLWSGDEGTTTAPIAAQSLLGGLALGFPSLDFQSFLEATSCPVPWPVQTYLGSISNQPRASAPFLDVRLVLLFDSTAERKSAAQGIKDSAQALTSFDASNRCVSIPGGVGPGGWLARDNVLILLGSNDPGVRSIVDAALTVAESL
jgi:hypothetical protein